METYLEEGLVQVSVIHCDAFDVIGRRVLLGQLVRVVVDAGALAVVQEVKLMGRGRVLRDQTAHVDVEGAIH